MERDIARILINETQLAERVRRLAPEISASYRDLEEGLTLVAVLCGSIIFLGGSDPPSADEADGEMSTDLLRPSPMTNLPEAAVDAPSAAAPATADKVAVPADLLDGGEVVILAIKPSLWTVLFSSFQWLLGGAVIVAFGRWFAPGWIANAVLVQSVLAVIALRAGFAVMQWVSRVYVLTNRRVMRIRGVFRADVFACPLVKVINTGIAVAPHEALTRLGTIWFNTGQDTVDGSWYHTARPHEVHAQIRRAIERALDHQQ